MASALGTRQCRVPVLLGLVAAGLASGQTCLVERLRVQVRDPNGAGIAGAEVRLSQTGAVNLASRTTGETGLAVFENLPCGVWTVSASKNGFGELTGGTVQITSTSTDLDLTLAASALRSEDSAKNTAA